VRPLDRTLRRVSRVAAGLDTKVGADHGTHDGEQRTQRGRHIRSVLERTLEYQHCGEGHDRNENESERREPETISRAFLRVLWVSSY
jgi:hypothetical protein